MNPTFHQPLILIQAVQGPDVPRTGVDPLPFVLVGGSIILGVALAYGIMRNRKRTRAERVHTDEATRALQREERNKP
jgi:hypothetical protein